MAIDRFHYFQEILLSSGHGTLFRFRGNMIECLHPFLHRCHADKDTRPT